MHRRSKGKLKAFFRLFAIAAAVPVLSMSVLRAMPIISETAGLSAGLALGGLPPAEQPNASRTDTLPVQTFTLSLNDKNMLSTELAWGEIPSSENEDAPVDESSVSGPKPYPQSIENHDGVISAVQYQKSDGTQFFSLDKAGQVRNTTSVPQEVLINESKKLPEFKTTTGTDPQVLIMHTHTTESYEPYTRDFYDASFNSRTTDEAKNMVSVGNKIEEQLKSAGIGVIHDKTIHDYPSYNGSYDRSAVTVKNILAQYPSIKVVLDVHRDAIEKNGGERIAPTVEINGRKAAQVMIISGCDDGTMNMPNYLQNFRFACLLQQQMESDYSGLTRPILFAYKKYNQNLTTGSLLVEVGGHANSIDEAQYSGELIGKSLAKALMSY